MDKTCARRSLRHYNLRLGKLPKAQKKSASDALAILREMQQAAVVEMPEDTESFATECAIITVT